MAKRSLKTILAMPDSRLKSLYLFSFILKSMPYSSNWQIAKKEYERVTEAIK